MDLTGHCHVVAEGKLLVISFQFSWCRGKMYKNLQYFLEKMCKTKKFQINPNKFETWLICRKSIELSK